MLSTKASKTLQLKACPAPSLSDSSNFTSTSVFVTLAPPSLKSPFGFSKAPLTSSWLAPFTCKGGEEAYKSDQLTTRPCFWLHHKSHLLTKTRLVIQMCALSKKSWLLKDHTSDVTVTSFSCRRLAALPLKVTLVMITSGAQPHLSETWKKEMPH